MKINAYDVRNPKNEKLEVYKVQLALFGGPAVLIYNEDKTQVVEETNLEAVQAVERLIKKQAKGYACGYQDNNGKIILVDIVEDKKYWF